MKETETYSVIKTTEQRHKKEKKGRGFFRKTRLVNINIIQQSFIKDYFRSNIIKIDHVAKC